MKNTINSAMTLGTANAVLGAIPNSGAYSTALGKSAGFIGAMGAVEMMGTTRQYLSKRYKRKQKKYKGWTGW